MVANVLRANTVPPPAIVRPTSVSQSRIGSASGGLDCAAG